MQEQAPKPQDQDLLSKYMVSDQAAKMHESKNPYALNLTQVAKDPESRIKFRVVIHEALHGKPEAPVTKESAVRLRPPFAMQAYNRMAEAGLANQGATATAVAPQTSFL